MQVLKATLSIRRLFGYCILIIIKKSLNTKVQKQNETKIKKSSN